MHSTEGPAHRFGTNEADSKSVSVCTPLDFLPTTKASQNLWIGTDSRSSEGHPQSRHV
jgi:hypothetical protein